MRWGSSSSSSGPDTTSVGDLFAGVAIALLIILVVLWLQSLADAYEIRKLKKMKQIFDVAFSHLGESDKDINVDRERGEITLRAEQAFASGEWLFTPDAPTREAFVRTRDKLALVLEKIEEGFRQSDIAHAFDPREHVEVLVVGHTDCKPFSRSMRRVDSADPRTYRLDDNWDLSVLRAAALARFFTEACPFDPQDACCPDGSRVCAPELFTRRIHPTWRVLPAGRSQYEPRAGSGDAPVDFLRACPELASGEAWLSRQRRVVVQIVPRMDKFIVREATD